MKTKAILFTFLLLTACSQNAQMKFSKPSSSAAKDSGIELNQLNAQRIAAGTHFTCAIDSEDDLYCWGNNTNGNLGDGTVLTSPFPVRVQFPEGSDVLDIAIGHDHACAIVLVQNARKLYCWGSNDQNQINGSGTTQFQVPNEISLQEMVAGEEIDAVVWQIALGADHTCALTTHNLFCWGLNIEKQSGQSTGTIIPIPTIVSSIAAASVFKLVAYGATTCIQDFSDNLYCFGGNTLGELGIQDLSVYYTEVPTRVLDTAGQPLKIKSIAESKWKSNCAVSTDNKFYCWGTNLQSFLSQTNATWTDKIDTAKLTNLQNVSTAALGTMHGCAKTNAGETFCWGIGLWGATGAETGDNYSHFHFMDDAVVLADTAVEFALGAEHTCFITTDAKVKCMGRNQFGQLGIGNPANGKSLKSREQFNKIFNPKELDFTDMIFANSIANQQFVYAIEKDHGWLIRWGGHPNEYEAVMRYFQPKYCESGQTCDDADEDPDNDFTDVNLENVKKVVAGNHGHACAMIGMAVPYNMICWDIESSIITNSDSVSEVLDIGMGLEHQCYLDSSGKAFCRGKNTHGQLGIGSLDDSIDDYVQAGELQGLERIFVSQNNTCASKVNENNSEQDDLFCWGQNDYNQTGFGRTLNSTTGLYEPSLISSPVLVLEIGDGLRFTKYQVDPLYDSPINQKLFACLLAEGANEKKGLCWGDVSWLDSNEGNETDPIEALSPTTALDNAVDLQVHRDSICILNNNMLSCKHFEDDNHPFQDLTLSNAKKFWVSDGWDYSYSNEWDVDGNGNLDDNVARGRYHKTICYLNTDDKILCRGINTSPNPETKFEDTDNTVGFDYGSLFSPIEVSL